MLTLNFGQCVGLLAIWFVLKLILIVVTKLSETGSRILYNKICEIHDRRIAEEEEEKRQSITGSGKSKVIGFRSTEIVAKEDS